MMIKKLVFIIPILWLLQLVGCKLYISIYVIVAMLAMTELFRNRLSRVYKPRASSLIIGACITISEFELYMELPAIFAIIRFALLLMTSFYTIEMSCNLLDDIIIFISQINNKHKKNLEKKDMIKYLAAIFTFCSVVFALYWYIMGFPAVISDDSVDILSQALGYKEINNKTSIWYKKTLSIILGVGLKIFNDANKAVALFSMVQIIMISLCISYMSYCLIKIGVSRRIVLIIVLIYTIMPYSLAYASTMWMDVPFSYAGMMAVSSLMVILFKDRIWGHWLVMIVSIIVMAEARRNAIPAIAIMLVMAAVIYMRELSLKRILALLLAIGLAIFAFPYFVGKGTSVFGMSSIPMQQVARVVWEGKPLEPEEVYLISQMADLEDIKEAYTEDFVDDLRKKCNREYFLKHPRDYAELYLNLGLRYPGTYLKGYIAQTRGYYSAMESEGYAPQGVKYKVNKYGIYMRNYSEEGGLMSILNRLCTGYVNMWDNIGFLQIFVSIGAYTWICIYAIDYLHSNAPKRYIMVPLLSISVLVSLLLSTPVSNLFRYMYVTAVSLPLYVGMLIALTSKQYKTEKEITNE